MNSLKADQKESFTEINLLELQRKKAPKRLLYFSDGILEEYSTDDDELDSNDQESQPLIDPKSLKWAPYFGYILWLMGSRTLAVCDYLGENLAWFFGITSPKFQYELDQFEKIAKEEEELEKQIKAENAGWTADSSEQKQNAVSMQPKLNTLNNGLKKDVEVGLSGDEKLIVVDSLRKKGLSSTTES